jgi:hypothetical protein
MGQESTSLKQKGGSILAPAGCVGEYTHMRPTKDRAIMDRVGHIPVTAGSAVFWDNQISHANAYRHDGLQPWAVVYCFFLPDITLNRSYVQNQLEHWQQGEPPKDQWNHIIDNNNDNAGTIQTYSFTSLGRKLMGLDPW